MPFVLSRLDRCNDLSTGVNLTSLNSLQLLPSPTSPKNRRRKHIIGETDEKTWDDKNNYQKTDDGDDDDDAPEGWSRDRCQMA